MRWAGARAEAGRRHPQGTRGSIRWSTTARNKTVRDIASQVEPDTQVRHSPTPPGAQDTGRGRPEAPSNKTNSPRHTRQPKPCRQPCRPPAERKDTSVNKINLSMI